MSDYRAMVITAVVCLGVVALTVVWAFIIGFIADANRPRYRRPSYRHARGETPSSVDCPVHGAGCEG